MRLAETVELHCKSTKFYVVDKSYGHIISGPYDTYEEAFKIASARPYGKVTTNPEEDTPEMRELKRQQAVVTNPDNLG